MQMHPPAKFVYEYYIIVCMIQIVPQFVLVAGSMLSHTGDVVL